MMFWDDVLAGAAGEYKHGGSSWMVGCGCSVTPSVATNPTVHKPCQVEMPGKGHGKGPASGESPGLLDRRAGRQAAVRRLRARSSRPSRPTPPRPIEAMEDGSGTTAGPGAGTPMSVKARSPGRATELPPVISW